MRATSRISTRTAVGAVLKTSRTKPITPEIFSPAPPGPSWIALSAASRMAHCSAKTLSSSSSLFWK